MGVVGHPNAVQGNIGDINNKTGDLAKGLVQVIGSTFRAYHVDGTPNNVFDPIANLAAGINYARHRYGPGMGYIGRGARHGYADGGMVRDVPVFDRGGTLAPGNQRRAQQARAPRAARARRRRPR
ncbi:Transglycosylase SLT domain [Dermacoccus nishinomiyaensis]|nr:Transglycosylase SLT domain [Dermacoccus nishinomiyaensis]